MYVKWKSHFVEHRDRPQIEVQCDLKTEKTRKAGRKFISEALEVRKMHLQKLYHSHLVWFVKQQSYRKHH